MMVSVVIPVYNEEKIVAKNIERLEAFLSANFDSHEIIAVDDGSSDDSVNILLKTGAAVISLGKNMGKGAAVRAGMLYASGDYLFFTDADLPYPFEFFTEAVNRMKNCHIACGRRYGGYPVIRRIFSSGYNAFVRLVLGFNSTDIQCGIKGYRKNVAKQLFSLGKTDSFAFDTETLFLAYKLGYQIDHIDVLLQHRMDSAVSPVSDGISMAADILKIRSAYKKGVYNIEKASAR